MRPKLARISVIIAVGVALAACGGGSSDTDAEGDEVKKTTLELGETATLTGASDTYEIAVSFEAEEGAPDDLEDFRLDGDEKEMTPWYVRSTFTNEAKDDLTKDDAYGFSPDALDDGGLEAKEIGLLGDFPKCELVNMPDRFPAGDSFDSCSVYLVPKGGTLAKIVVEVTKFEGANERYTWTVS